MRRITPIFCCLLFSFLIAASELPKPITFDAVFVDRALSLEEPSNLMWLPDGKHILYRFGSGDDEALWIEEAQTGEKRRVVSWPALLEELSGKRPNWKKPGLGDVNSASRSRFKMVLSPDGTSLVGFHAGDLYSLDLASGKARFLTGDAEPEIHPAFSPDGTRLGFVRSGDVYWLDIKTGVTHRVTDGGGVNCKLNGVADWVYEEELGAKRSYWWSPNGKQLAFLHFDDSPVAVVPITSDSMLYPDLERQHYPKAGTANPKVKLGVIGMNGGNPVWVDTGNADQYLVRAGWTPSGDVWVQRLNRDQTILELLLADPATGSSRVLLVEEDPAWINLSEDLRFFEDGRFLWTSERSGWRHLYLFGADGTLERQLTSGAWPIHQIYGFDTEKSTIFFQASRKNHRQRQIYALDISSGEIRGIGDTTGGSHAAILAPDGNFIVDTWSNLNTPPRIDLVTSSGNVVRRLWETGEELKNWDLLPVETGEIKADDGTVLDSLLVRPRDFDPSKKYPVVLYVYGGPHSQLTVDQWSGSTHHTFRYFAEEGFAVFLIDNRGTFGRGHAFETIVHRRLGEYEVADQLAAARWLKAQPWVDADRIAVYGGSYGGYMTLLCLLTAPDVFRAGIAYAPVTDWQLYDSAYTERYMDTPQDNPEGYKVSAPLTYAENLRGALLLAHGAMDNNVHFQNTLQLIAKLAASEKQFEIMVYPRTRHGVRLSQYRIHFHRLKIDFLKRHLMNN